jgi:hypothetical protein
MRTTNARKACLLHSSPVLLDPNHFAGKPVSHQFAKELLAGFVGGEVDKLAETKGMDEYDKIEAHRHAKRSAENMYDQHYVQDQGADQYDPNQYDRPQRLNYRDQNY